MTVIYTDNTADEVKRTAINLTSTHYRTSMRMYLIKLVYELASQELAGELDVPQGFPPYDKLSGEYALLAGKITTLKSSMSNAQRDVATSTERHIKSVLGNEVARTLREGFTVRKLLTRIDQLIQGLHGNAAGSFSEAGLNLKYCLENTLASHPVFRDEGFPALGDFLPITYNPLTGEEDPSKKPTRALMPVFVTCDISGATIDKAGAKPTVYKDVYFSTEAFLKFIVDDIHPRTGEKWGKCSIIGFYCREADLWDVYYDFSRVPEKVSVVAASDSPQWFFKDGSFYTFDPDKFPFFVRGKGWVSDVSRYTEITPGNYFDLTSPVFPYDTDVLQTLDGFKSMPYEETLREDPVSSRNTLFMGVELEVEMSNTSTMGLSDAARLAWKTLAGDGIVVRDGSLNGGFEMVSVPATLSYHHTIWERICRSDLRKQLVSYFRQSCGLHIHMSKECFSSYTLGMFITFINSAHNSVFIDTISQRKKNSYCQRSPSKVSKGGSRNTFVDADGRSHDKYWATNLGNPHTLEVRMFKGTLAFKGVMKSLEFCHALHRYVSSGVAHSKLDYEHFIQWLTGHVEVKTPQGLKYVKKEPGYRTLYPFLFEYLVKFKFIEDNEKLGDILAVNQEDVSDDGTLPKSATKKYTVSQDKLDLIRRANAERKKKLA